MKFRIPISGCLWFYNITKLLILTPILGIYLATQAFYNDKLYSRV